MHAYFDIKLLFLADNLKIDQYFYQIIVFTGHQKDAGTESKVNKIESILYQYLLVL